MKRLIILVGIMLFALSAFCQPAVLRQFYTTNTDSVILSSRISLINQILTAKTNPAVKVLGNLGLQYTNGITMNGVVFLSFDITNDNLFIGQAAGGLFNYQNSMGSPPAGGGIQPFMPSHVTGLDNIGLGFGAFQDVQDGRENYGMGLTCAWQVSHGSFNVVIGSSMSNGCQSSSNNVVLGCESGAFSDAQGTILIGANAQQNDSGSYTNVVIGNGAANNWGGNEFFNIIIGDNQGVSGEHNTIHIGTDGEQTNVFISGQIHGNGSGITNVTANAPTSVVTNLTLGTSGAYAGHSIQILPFNVVLIEAAVAGVSGIQIEVVGQCTNRLTGLTAATSVLTGNVTNQLGGIFVPAGSTWFIRDISTGSGNSSKLGNQGQQIIVY